MIQLNHVTFGYSSKSKLFEDLNLSIKPGHIYGLLGKNGAGKSSLLRNIAGLLFPLSGKVEVDGFVPAQRKPAFLEEMFFMPEEIYLPSVSIETYLSTVAKFYPRFDESLFYSHIREFEIPEANKLTNISFGQKKKFLIAFALAANTKTLIMDEPTNGLDIPSKSQFRKIVSTGLDADRTIIISTHQVRDLDNLIDSIIILEDSKILIQDTIDRVTEKLYFGILPEVESNTNVLFSEPSLRGYKAVAENYLQEESRIDLEHLFQAATAHPARIQKIFQDS